MNQDDPDGKVVNLYVFPDLSFIDEWGITYYACGVVRGIDLATVMAYQPWATPTGFPRRLTARRARGSHQRVAPASGGVRAAVARRCGGP